MILVDEYKHSLKNADIEEYVDLLVFRPLAFLFVKAIYVTELTPNQITLLSMVVGVGSGICFGLGGRATMVAGGILLGIATVFDCADGQLARLKKNGTHFGRILDGVSDYVYTVAAFFGIAIGCRVEGMEVWVWWMFVGSAGLSYAIQAGLLDYYRNEYMARAGGRSGFLTDELEEVVEERAKLSGEKGRFVAKALLLVYIEYSKLQRRFGG
ncbi:MAG TPA: CDP-alcohol phosphatidyltransferase family protein, partial [Bacteroidota bacterium]|nr:CDP-alcohol phosphatidyltransferase family protein [Bacteroidota bacterium]